jgi:hypothetical protein
MSLQLRVKNPHLFAGFCLQKSLQNTFGILFDTSYISGNMQYTLLPPFLVPLLGKK